jgi:hypothetical protein
VATLLETGEGSSLEQRQQEALEKRELKAKADLEALIGLSAARSSVQLNELPSARRSLPVPV